MTNHVGTAAVSQTAHRKNFKLSALTLVIATAIQGHAVQAKETNSEEVRELAISEVSANTEESYKVDNSTSEKYTQPLLNTPKSITVVSEAVMKDRNVDSLRDALRGVPGISMQAGEGGAPTGDSMSIRGFSTRNNIMIDGVRDIAGYSRDTYNVQSIEIAKGPGSSMYGRGAAGGVINLQSKTAKLDNFTDLSLRLGSEGDYRGKVDANVVIGETTALRVNLLADDGDTPGRDAVAESNNAIALFFETGLGTDSRFSVNADYFVQDNLPDYGLPWVPNYSGYDTRVIADTLAKYEGMAPPVNYTNFYGNVNRDFEDITGSSITLKYEKDLSDSTKIRVLGRTGKVARESIVSAPRFTYETITNEAGDEIRVYGGDEEIDTGGEKTRDTEDSMSVLQFDLIGQYKLAGATHDVVFGTEFAQEKFERWNYVDVVDDNLEDLTVDLYDPDYNLAFTGRYARTDKSNEATGTTAAIYLFDTITFNPQWQVSAGLRYDSFETEYYYDLDGDDPSLKLNAENQELSWNFGVVFSPAENGSIYFGAGNAFSPAAEDLTASTRGNAANLDPEEVVSLEFGTKWSLLNDNLGITAALFRTEKTNARTDDPFAEDDRDETLDGKQRVTGIELSAVGQITEELAVTLGYTYQDSEVVEAGGDDSVQIGQQLANTPEHSASLWGHYAITEKLAMGLGAQYMGERYNNTNPGSRELAEDYLVFDFMASYQFTDSFKVQLNAENLTDEDYADQIGGGHFVPGDGRYVSVNANYSF